MGKKDADEWYHNNSARVARCKCSWCRGNIYFESEPVKQPNGTYSAGQKIPDGTVFVLLSDSSGRYIATKRLDNSSWPKSCWLKNGYDPFGSDSMGGWLKDEYALYPGPVAKPVMSKDAPPGGSNCRKCKQNNPYAAPNKEDGTYVCYVCR